MYLQVTISFTRMYSRKDYLNNVCTFEQYYGQFVNEAVKRKVLRHFSKDVLKSSFEKDEHLNNLPMRVWDGVGGFAFRGGDMIMRPTSIEPVDIKLIREAGEGVSAYTMVCIYKEAARQIVRSYSEN